MTFPDPAVCPAMAEVYRRYREKRKTAHDVVRIGVPLALYERARKECEASITGLPKNEPLLIGDDWPELVEVFAEDA